MKRKKIREHFREQEFEWQKSICFLRGRGFEISFPSKRKDIYKISYEKTGFTIKLRSYEEFSNFVKMLEEFERETKNTLKEVIERRLQQKNS